MSTPRYDWWPYVKGMIRRYPELCRREADLHTTAVTPNYGGAPGGHGGRSDPVANAALRSLPEVNRREMDAVQAAIRYIQDAPDGEKRLEVIRLYYWKRSHTLYGAAIKVGVSERTAQKWNGDFIRLVAKNFGLLDDCAFQSLKSVVH